jgi:MtN3 and saliva related transmembrane protein
MDLTTAIGLAAGLLTTTSLVPQVTKIWKSKSAKDVSRRMFIAFCLGVALWLAYGIIKQDIPMMIWNSISLALALAILGMKLRFG